MVFFCKEVCGNFKYMKIPEYFFPQINKIRNYTLFLKKSLDSMLGESSDLNNPEEEWIDKNVLMGEIKVFKSLLSDNYWLESFQLEFQVQGVDSRKQGKTMIINKELVSQINQKVLQQTEKVVDIIHPGLQNTGQQIITQIQTQALQEQQAQAVKASQVNVKIAAGTQVYFFLMQIASLLFFA